MYSRRSTSRNDDETKKLLGDDKSSDLGKHPYGSLKDVKFSKDGKKPPPRKSSSLRDLYRYATALDVFLLILGTVFSVGVGVGWPLISLVFGDMTDTFIAAANSPFAKGHPVNRSQFPTIPPLFDNRTPTPLEINQTVNYLKEITRDEFEASVIDFSLRYVYIATAILVCCYVYVACWQTACERQIHRLRKEFFKAILRQEVAYFDKHLSGELTSKLADDLDRVKEGIGDKVGTLLQGFSQFITGLIIAMIKSWLLTLVMLALMPLIIISGAFMAKMVANFSKNEQEKYGIAGGVAEEALSCIRTVIAFNGQKRETDRYAEALEKGKQLGVKKNILTGANLSVMFFVMFCSYALSFWYGSKLIVDGSIDQGTVFVVFFCVLMGGFAFGNAIPQISTIATARGAAYNIYEIIDTKPVIDPYSKLGKKPVDIQSRIEFSNVRFAYPTRPDVTVLSGLSFVVEPGETVALVGPSGCGKSTVVNLLLRNYDTTGGEVFIDGHEVKSLNVRWLRQTIGVVSQEPVLFDASIAENIRYGRKDVSEEEMVRACRMSNAHDFITKLPNGYNTLVGERGAQLSGGQKQRIAIARALVRDPKILLLDEATSALDAESEGIVQQALEKAQENRTTLIIAHRLSTIRNADKIIVIQQGQMAEFGTHSELMTKRGLYFDLITAQTFEDTGYVTNQNTGTEGDLEETYNDDTAGLRKRSTRTMRRQRTVSGASSASSNGSAYTRQSSRRMSRMLSRTAPGETEKERLQEALEEENVQKSNFFQIMKTARKEWCYIFLGLIGATIRGVVMPLFALTYSQMFEVFSKPPDELLEGARQWSFIFVLIGILNAIGSMTSIYFLGAAGEALTMRLRLGVFKNLLRQDASYFDDQKHATGKLCTRLATDAPAVKAALDFRMASVLQALISMVAGVVIAFVYGWKMALMVLALLPVLGLASVLNVKLRMGFLRKDNILFEEAGKVAAEGIENIRTVQSLTRELTFYETFCSHLQHPYEVALKNAHLHAIGYAFATSCIFFMYAAAFRFGGYLVLIGDIPPLDVFKVFFAIAFCGMTLGFATSYFPEYAKARMSAALIFKMIDEVPKIDSYATTGLKPELSGTITFKSIHFAYPSRITVPVLRGLSFNVQSGRTLALVGMSGCGKSTVVSLIERLYDPLDGQILADDFDLRTINVQYMRERISLVSQEPVLFDCSIRDNITYGMDKGVPYERIVESAKLANIHDFVLSLPQGYDTRVGEKGTQLSGGQKQRVAIARALVRDPKILLLDEATSALDTESERLVQEALDRARQGRTSLIIAHRLSTVQSADVIAVIKRGRVVELGSHAELVSQRGIYYELTKKQNLLLEESQVV